MTGVASQKSTFDYGNWGNSACAVMDNGELACWGSGDRYLIYQNTSNSITPVVRDDFPSGISVSEISLGAYHRCALMSNSKVYCWGSAYPSFGGQSFTYNRASPTVVQDSAGNDILATQVSSDGDQHSCAILINGSAVCWGYNYYGQLGVGYRCVTGAEGDCQSAWNDYNQEYLEMPTQVVIPSGRTVVALNTHPGDAHGTCFVLDDGSYMCPGSSFGTQGTPVYANQSYNGDIIYDVVAASGRSVTLSNGDIRFYKQMV
jgi:alpha-tubulin suppressor-like RCC1 family protein